MITSKRWPNQADNLMVQKERRAANLSRDVSAIDLKIMLMTYDILCISRSKLEFMVR